MRVWLGLAVALSLAGCNGVKHETASGRPEVTIRSSAEPVKSAVTGFLVNAGYSITKSSDIQVVGERTPDNAMAAVLFGSQYDSTPKARITYTILPLGGTTRVIADMAIVTNPGSAFERVTPLNNVPESAGVQRSLIDVKAALEAGKSAGGAVAEAVERAQARNAAAQAAKNGTSSDKTSTAPKPAS